MLLLLQNPNTVNNYPASPKPRLPAAPSPCLFRLPSPYFSSLSPLFSPPLRFSLIFLPLPFSSGSLNRMLILTGGFQSSFSSRCALRVHRHKVTALLQKKKRELVFSPPSCVSCLFFSPSLLSLVSEKKKREKTFGLRFKVTVTANPVHAKSGKKHSHSDGSLVFFSNTSEINEISFFGACGKHILLYSSSHCSYLFKLYINNCNCLEPHFVFGHICVDIKDSQQVLV